MASIVIRVAKPRKMKIRGTRDQIDAANKADRRRTFLRPIRSNPVNTPRFRQLAFYRVSHRPAGCVGIEQLDLGIQPRLVCCLEFVPACHLRLKPGLILFFKEFHELQITLVHANDVLRFAQRDFRSEELTSGCDHVS